MRLLYPAFPSVRTSAEPTSPRCPATKILESLFMCIIRFGHKLHELLEFCFRFPTQFFLGLCIVPEKHIYFCWAEVFRVDFDNRLAGLLINSFFFQTFTFPDNVHTEMLCRFF